MTGALVDGGETTAITARWDADWSDHVFTSVEYEYQELEDLSFAIPLTTVVLPIGSAETQRLTATANVWITGGFGLFGTVSRNWSEIIDGFEQESPGGTLEFGPGHPVPFIPECSGQIGVTWVHPAQIRATVVQNFVGERAGNIVGDMLDGYTTTDIAVTWQPFEKRLELGVQVLNLFDTDFDVFNGVPSPGRTIFGTARVRF